MARIPEYPPILLGSAEDKIEQLRQFLIRMVRASVDEGDFSEDEQSIEELQEQVITLTGTVANVLTSVSTHLANTHNPHDVTAEQTEAAPEEHTHEMEDITDFPGIPQNLSDFTDDLGSSPVHNHDSRYYTETEINTKLSGKADEPETEGTAGQVYATDGNGGRYWKTVESGSGGTGDYIELENKPKINSVELVGNKSLSDLGAAEEEHSHTTADITDFPTLSTVATSGSYNDLTDKPTAKTLQMVKINTATQVIQAGASGEFEFSLSAAAASYGLPKGIIGIHINSDRICLNSYYISGSTATVRVLNPSTSAWNVQVILNVLFESL